MHELLHPVPSTLQQATTDLHLHWRLLDTPRHVWVSLLWGHCSFLLGPGVHNVLFVPFKSLFPSPVYFPVLCKFWPLYGGVNGDLLQEGLCYTQVCCTQGPCPCGSPLLTRTYTGDTQTQFCLSLCGVSGSWCTQGLFEPSECLWWRWGVTLKANSSLLPSCWGFSALGRRVSPQSRSSTSILLGFSDLGRGVSPQGRSSATQPWKPVLANMLLYSCLENPAP